MRRRMTIRRAPRKPLVWINIPFGSVAFSKLWATRTSWCPRTGKRASQDSRRKRAVLRAIVGEIVWKQTAVGTAGGNGFWGIYARAERMRRQCRSSRRAE